MDLSKESILDRYPHYEATIGIEVHVQLKTNTKIFCACPNQFGDEQNKNICEICTGQPGTLPVLNKRVLDFAIMTGLATNCTINHVSEFARKHYMYPDLPKNYQITQDDKPICINGFLSVNDKDGKPKKIRIARIHMEEDAGKNIHHPSGKSLVNLNRAGAPLLETVSEPDIANAQEAKNYLMQLRNTVRYLGVSDANMDEGAFRADINISVKKKSDTKLGTRTEIKNMNSFKFIGQAIDYEIERQITLIEDGGSIKQETRLWDTSNHKTILMRSKGDAQDYQYFIEPDLPLISIDDSWIDTLREKLPELPQAKFRRLQEDYGLSEYESNIIIEDQELADYFERTVILCRLPKLACNWILRDLLGYIKESKSSLEQSIITPAHIAELVIELDRGTINTKAAQIVFEEMVVSRKKPKEIIEEKGLKQIDSESELKVMIEKIITENPDNVAKYKSGNDRIFAFFVGQAMKATKGNGNPTLINQLFKKLLD